MSGKILDVPYKSQHDADARAMHADCGPCCVAMILGATGRTVTTDAVTAASGVMGEQGLTFDQMCAAARGMGLDMFWHVGYALEDLKGFIDSGQPPIALIRYGQVPDRWDQRYTAGHYVVVVGYDDDEQRVYINDPDYLPGPEGYQRAYPYETFSAAWGGFAGDNPNFSLIVPRLDHPVSGTALGAGGMETVGAPHDVWVVAPAGLLLRTQRDVPASPTSPVLVFGQHLTAYGPELGPDARGRSWLLIRTDSGLTGWAPASAGNYRYLSDSKPGEPYPVVVLDTLPVQQAGALRVRDDRDINSTVVDNARVGERLIVYGRVVERDGTPWLWVKSPRGKYGWAREVADGYTLVGPAEPPPPLDVRPFGKCLTGVGMANPQLLSLEEMAVVATSGVEAVMLLTLPDPDQNRQLVNELLGARPDLFMIARLYFSVDIDSLTRFSPQAFADTVSGGLNALYQSGVRYFEVHNEPNLPTEGMGWNWADGAAFGDWFIQVVSILRRQYPDAKFGFPGVSPQPNADEFLDGAAPAGQAADWVGAHAYWQTLDDGPYPMTGVAGGMNWKRIRDRFPDKLIMITEFSNNSVSVTAADKGQQYARYYQLLRHETNVGAAFAFAISWPGQDMNREGWVFNGQPTGIANTLAALIGQPGYLA